MGTADRIWQLDDAIATVTKSIADAELEHAAGELTKAELDRIVASDTTRLAELEAERANLLVEDDHEGATHTEATDQHQVVRVRSVWKRNVGLGAIAAGLAVALVSFAGVRLPGQQATGNVTQTNARALHDQLVEAETAAAAGDAGRALELFNAVLAKHPQNAEALAESGWLTYQAGLVGQQPATMSAGANLIARSITIDPGAPAGHLYAALIDSREGRPSSLVRSELIAFAHASPASWLIKVAQPFLDRYDVVVAKP